MALELSEHQSSVDTNILQPVHIHIEPTRGWISLDLRGLWAYRELLYFLAWRDIKVRYKQTVLGAAWSILQPVLTMVVFSLFSGELAGVPLPPCCWPMPR